jgi:hypothetical protein
MGEMGEWVHRLQNLDGVSVDQVFPRVHYLWIRSILSKALTGKDFSQRRRKPLTALHFSELTATGDRKFAMAFFG